MIMFRIVFTQKITEEYILYIFKGPVSIAAIPLGTIESDARQKADDIIAACKDVDGYDDQS